jgi:hypothetical protein
MLISLALQQSDLHVAINLMQSLNNVSNKNVITPLDQPTLNDVIQDLRTDCLDYIGGWDTAILGWTQLERLCSTKWNQDSLEHPTNEAPDYGDVDGYLYKHSVCTTPGTTLEQIRTVEMALDAGQSIERGPAVWEHDLPPSYLVNLNIHQASLVQPAAPFVTNVYKCLIFQDEMKSFVTGLGPYDDESEDMTPIPNRVVMMTMT